MHMTTCAILPLQLKPPWNELGKQKENPPYFTLWQKLQPPSYYMTKIFHRLHARYKNDSPITIWASRHLNTGIIGSAILCSSTKHRQPCWACRNVKTAILSPALKSAPSHFHLIPNSDTDGTRSWFFCLRHHNLCKAPKNSKSAHSKPLVHVMHMIASPGPLSTWHSAEICGKSKMAATFSPQPNARLTAKSFPSKP